MKGKSFFLLFLLNLLLFFPVCLYALAWLGDTGAFSFSGDKITHLYNGWDTIYADVEYDYPDFVFKVRMTPAELNGAGNSKLIYFMSTTPDPDYTDGYYIIAPCDGSPIRVVKISGSDRTDIITSDVTCVKGTEYSIEVRRTNGSTMELYIDGEFQGEAIESEFTTCNYWIIQTDAEGAAISDPYIYAQEEDKPDLRISGNVNWTGDKRYISSFTGEVTFTVTNDGGGDWWGYVYVKLWLSQDSSMLDTSSVGAYPIDEWAHGNLYSQRQWSSVETFTAGSNIADGTYYLWLYVNEGGRFDESNPDNNTHLIQNARLIKSPPYVDIYSTKPQYGTGDNIIVNVYVETDRDVDLYAAILLNLQLFWYPVWDETPHKTVFSSTGIERIVDVPTTGVPNRSYSFYAAITEHNTFDIIGDVDMVTITVKK